MSEQPHAQYGRPPRILIGIVNFRTPALVISCLESLVDEVAAYPDARVVVVDNASGDDSWQRIDEAIQTRGWRGWASALASPVNGGFAGGNNLAIAAALGRNDAPDLIWLLNPDTRVNRGALTTLVEFLDTHADAGIVGTMLEEADGSEWPYAFRFPSILGEIERGARFGPVSRLLRHHAGLRRIGRDPEIVDWVSGASMMIRRKVFESTGLMDDGYFLYFEETDLCLQARRANWKCYHVPDARVLHLAGQSTGLAGGRAGSRRMPSYWFESRRRYFVKNHGRAYAIVADIVWMCAHMMWRLGRCAQMLPFRDSPALLRDFMRHSALFKGTGRRSERQI